MSYTLTNTIIEDISKLPKTVDELHSTNDPSIVDIMESDQTDQRDMIQQTIDVSVDLLQRLYSSLYIANQVIMSDRIGDEERESVGKMMIQSEIIDCLATKFPDMNEFEFDLRVDVEENGNRTLVVVGKNSFSKTLLNAINEAKNAPLDVIETCDDDEFEYDYVSSYMHNSGDPDNYWS